MGVGLLLTLAAVGQQTGAAYARAGSGTVVLTRISGVVYISPPNEATAALVGSRTVPVGTTVDVSAANARVGLRASTGQQGVFYGDEFVIQSVSAADVDLALSRSGIACPPKKATFQSYSSVVLRKRRPPKKGKGLWGNAKGRFQTSGRYAIVAVRGTVWLTRDGCDGTFSEVTRGKVQVSDLITGQNVTLATGKSHLAKAPLEYEVPQPDSAPTGITTGPDGNIWFTEQQSQTGDENGNIVRFTFRARRFTAIQIPVGPQNPDYESGGSQPTEIVNGQDGALWITDAASNQVVRLVPGQSQPPTSIATDDATNGITVGPDHAIWFTDANNPEIGRIAKVGTTWQVSYVQIPSGNAAGDITSAAGQLWFTSPQDDAVWSLNPGATPVEHPQPLGSEPTGIAVGPDGNLWFTENGADEIGRITTTGATLTPFSLTPGAMPTGITLGGDKRVWFTETGLDNIGRLTAAGRLVELPLPSATTGAVDAQPTGITAGPEGTIWFTEPNTGANGVGCIGQNC